MTTKIRLEFDYECNPLWDISHPEKGIDTLDYSEVGIPDELQYSLSKLNKEYQLTYNSTDPMNSGFRSKELFKSRGGNNTRFRRLSY